jgi:hypothetical protein
MGDESVTLRRRARIFCFILIGLAYLISVPWYRETGAPLRIWFGLPDWVAVALLCYVAVAVFNALAWSLLETPDEASEPDPVGFAGGRDLRREPDADGSDPRSEASS